MGSGICPMVVGCEGVDRTTVTGAGVSDSGNVGGNLVVSEMDNSCIPGNTSAGGWVTCGLGGAAGSWVTSLVPWGLGGVAVGCLETFGEEAVDCPGVPGWLGTDRGT